LPDLPLCLRRTAQQREQGECAGVCQESGHDLEPDGDACRAERDAHAAGRPPGLRPGRRLRRPLAAPSAGTARMPSSPSGGPAARTGGALALVAGLAARALAGAGLWPRLSRPAQPACPAGPAFVDTAAAAGLNYRWEIPGKRPLNILQTIGNGCAFLD